MQSPAGPLGWADVISVCCWNWRDTFVPQDASPSPGPGRVMDGHEAQAPCLLLGPSITLAGVITLKMKRAFLIFPRAQHCWGKPSDILRRCNHPDLPPPPYTDTWSGEPTLSPFVMHDLGRSIPSHFGSLLIIVF